FLAAETQTNRDRASKRDAHHKTKAAALTERVEPARPVRPPLINSRACSRPYLLRAWRDRLAHHDAAAGHIGLGLGNAVLTDAKDARGQHCIGLAFEDAVGQVLQIADAAGEIG